MQWRDLSREVSSKLKAQQTAFEINALGTILNTKYFFMASLIHVTLLESLKSL